MKFRSLSRLTIAAFFMTFSLLAKAQPAAFNSHEVDPNGSITFRYNAPAAKKVLLELDGVAAPIPMKKDHAGLWTYTTPPLPPQIYGYAFEVDGQAHLDPKNWEVKPNLIYLGNAVTVPGKTPQLWDALEVPHGALHHHFYTSKTVLGLSNGQSDYFVYTPPNYDPASAQPYPVLYLLHGWSDTTSAWTEVGEANFIFDNLIAQQKARPMIVVMPNGYGDMQFVRGGQSQWDDDQNINHNLDLFTQALLTEVLPQIESQYHVSTDRNDRAITGLSMGGLESLSIGLTHSTQFAWVGGFSSAAAALDHKVGIKTTDQTNNRSAATDKKMNETSTKKNQNKNKTTEAGNNINDVTNITNEATNSSNKNEEDNRLSGLTAKSADLRLLWIACGSEDDLITPNRQFISWLKSKDIPVTAIETPGMHTWMVWRDNLIHFTPLLFQTGSSPASR
jgi:enterochelin esterase family protein